MRDSFIFYRSFYEAIKDLPRDIQGEVYTAIMEYGLNGTTTENLKPLARSIFTLIKPILDFGNKQYLNGIKGGRPKKEKPKQNPDETQTKPNQNPNKDVDVDVEKDEENTPPIVPQGGQRVGYEFFGTFHNVELKPMELRKLQMDFGESETQSAIDDLSCKLMDGTTQSQAHYATLTYWLSSRRKMNRQGQQKTKGEKLNEAYEKTKELLGLNDED